MKKTIYIPIEIKPREFLSQVFLAAVAAKYGYRTYIGTKSAVNTILCTKKNKGGIFLYKGGHSLDYTKFIAKCCDVHAVIDQEMGPVIEDYEKRIPLRFNPGTLKYIDRYYAIGNLAFKAARQSLKDLKGRVVKSGWPRIDLWREENKNYYEEQTKKIKKEHGDFLLFSSDFGYLSEERINGVYLQAKESENPEIVKGALNRLIKAEKAYAEFNIFLEKLKEWDNNEKIPKIIVRPHPSENIAVWESRLRDFKKTFCIYSGEITSWLYASVGVLHRGCTTGVQAYIANKPAAYIITDEKFLRNNLSEMLSKKIRNVKELYEWVTNIRTKEVRIFNIENQPKDFSERIFITRKFSSELIMEDFESLNVCKEELWVMKMSFYYKNLFLKAIRKFKRKKNAGKDINRYFIASKNQKIPGGITKIEAEEILRNLFPKIEYKINEPVNNCVQIEQ